MAWEERILNSISSRNTFRTWPLIQGALWSANSIALEDNPEKRCDYHCQCRVCELLGKYFSLADRLKMCTAKSPASSIPHPSCTRRFLFSGSSVGGCVASSYVERRTIKFSFNTKFTAQRSIKLTVLRTIRMTDSIAPRFSVPSFTCSDHLFRSLSSLHWVFRDDTYLSDYYPFPETSARIWDT